MVDYVWCEWHANEIMTFEPLYIPGLVQTPAYMEALLIGGGRAKSSAQARRWLRFRMRRTEILTREDAPKVDIVSYEPALHLLVGGSDVMRGQLDYLLKLIESEVITFRVLPYEQAAPIVQNGFVVFGLPRPLELVALTQIYNSHIFLDHRDVADDQAEEYSEIRRYSLSPSEAVDFIENLRKWLS